MYSSLRSLTSKPSTTGRSRSIQGLATRRAAELSGPGSARSPASARSSSGVARTGNWIISEIAAKSKIVSSPRGGRDGAIPPGKAMPEASRVSRSGAGRYWIDSGVRRRRARRPDSVGSMARARSMSIS